MAWGTNEAAGLQRARQATWVTDGKASSRVVCAIDSQQQPCCRGLARFQSCLSACWSFYQFVSQMVRSCAPVE